MKCPVCGSDDCILPAGIVLRDIFGYYAACKDCPPDPKIDKLSPYIDSGRIAGDAGKAGNACKSCKKRHLDNVMGNVLEVLRNEEIFDSTSRLVDIGTPLITFGYQIPYVPRLGRRSLILIMDTIDQDAAVHIIEKVPEIKGIIKRKGSQKESVGIPDTNSEPHIYELLAGCDMRCDIASSIVGELCIYKTQSKIHIEFNNRDKMAIIERLYMDGMITGKTVIDGFCGPGTLGLMCALAGAGKVILNDPWLPAIENTLINIEANKHLLDVDLKIIDKPKNPVGKEPELVASASGACEIEVYQGDFRNLHRIIPKADLCLIDTFPGIDARKYAGACKGFGRMVVV